MQDFYLYLGIFCVITLVIILMPDPPQEDTINFDKLYLDDINETLTPRERQALINYIEDYAWHYGRLYHIKDEKKIKEAIKEKFQLPEEVFKSI